MRRFEKVLTCDEVREQFNQAVDTVYDYFEQQYGIVPIEVQDALYDVLQTVIKEDGRLWCDTEECEEALTKDAE